MYTHHAQVLSNDIGAAPDVAALDGFSQRLPAVLVQMVQNGVASGDAGGAAIAMAGWDTDLLNEVWAMLDQKVQDKLTAAWPK